MLESGGIIFAELFDNLNAPCSMRLTIQPPSVMDEVAMEYRSTLCAATKAWLFLMRQQEDDPDRKFSITAKDDIMPPPRELIGHLERSLSVMREKWPYEMEVVDDCIFDIETAEVVLAAFPVAGGFGQNPSLIPSGYPGTILRVPSPASYFQNPEQDPALPPSQVPIGMTITNADLGKVIRDLDQQDGQAV